MIKNIRFEEKGIFLSFEKKEDYDEDEIRIVRQFGETIAFLIKLHQSLLENMIDELKS